MTHVDGSVDPIRDADTIETELMLADLESLEKQIANFTKKARGGDKETQAAMAIAEKAKAALDDGKAVRTIAAGLDEGERKILKGLQLLTAKPILYVCNVNEDEAATGNALTEKVAAMAAEQGAEVVVICAAIEAEIAQLDSAEEKTEFLETLGLSEAGLDKIIKAGFKLLGLQTYFTAGPKEARAWTVRVGAKAPQAAGVIHTDFEKGFIKAETIAYDDFISLNGEQGAKDAGKMRQEGKDYVVQDGDIILFRFNV